jgi:hypothetical protein
MNDWARTGIFLGAAALIGAVALFTGGRAADAPAQFSDEGEAFYPTFTDPAQAASLEVIQYDEATGSARPFKVQVKDGLWSIPSHYDYPADGEERLAKSAAGVIDLTKDIVQSDRAQDHEALGVIDPLDETAASLTGRGTRVTMRDGAGTALADFIIGKPVEGKQGFRSVRIPDKKRTYAVKLDVDLSTRFADWIETNLLDVQAFDISRVQIQDYAIDETTGSLVSQGSIALDKIDSQWTMRDLPPDKELQRGKVSTMTSALANLTITGVRPKPAGLSRDLSAREGLTLDLPTQLSLQSKGYFISQDGRLLSNEGDVYVGTSEGVLYTLRFGEILIGEGLEISAGIGAEGETETEPGAEGESAAAAGGENRYLFVTASFDETLLPPKPEAPEGYTPADAQPPPAEGEIAPPRDAAFVTYEMDLNDWQKRIDEGQAEATRLNNRFAPWYYVISAGDFGNIRLGRDALLQDKPAETTSPATPPAPIPDAGGDPGADPGTTPPPAEGGSGGGGEPDGR